MSALPHPIVRSLIACEEIRPDRSNPRRINLYRIVNSVRAVGDPPYPAVRKQFAVFAVVTNGRGRGKLWLEIRHADTDAIIYHTPKQAIAFPANPPEAERRIVSDAEFNHPRARPPLGSTLV